MTCLGFLMLKLIKKFTGDRSGQFAIMFGLLSFPLLASAGLAVDYASVSSQRGHIQNANDATALWAATYYRDNRRLPTALDTKAFIISNFPEEYGMEVGLPLLSYNDITEEVTIIADVSLNTFVMQAFGSSFQTAQVKSSAKVGIDAILEFALALDTTFSMSTEGRLVGLKAAANNFIDKIWEVVDSGADVKGAIVPFSNYVNVGTQYRSEPWTNVPADIDTRRTEEVCSRPTIYSNCRGGREQCTGPTPRSSPAVPAYWTGGNESCNDGVCTTSPRRLVPAQPARNWTDPRTCQMVDQTCDVSEGPEQCYTRTTGSLYTWQGVVSSLPYPQNLEDGNDVPFPGPLNVSAGSSLLRLTDDDRKLKSKINGLVAAGNTYIPDGIMWALRTLSPEAPFTEGRPVYTGAPGQKRIRKVIILMTDGENTASPDFTNQEVAPMNGDSHRLLHSGDDWRLANRYTKEACDLVKTKGYEVYTIAFGTSVNNTVKDLMEDCASTPDDYYNATTSRDLDEAFDEIANSLLRLRLTQ